jgi:hypothetical protein
MNAKVTAVQPADVDVDIDLFLVEQRDALASKLAAGRDQIARGEGAPLESLQALLREARERAGL